jgi:hypothetical protein
MGRALAAGDPLAKSMDALDKYPSISVGDLRMAVGAALRTGDPSAYAHATAYYANTASSEAPATYEAWFLLSCQYDFRCNIGAEIDRLKYEYKAVEFDAIQTSFARINAAITAKEWENLGF